MRQVFGVEWEALERDHVQAFLDEAEDEGLTWECKGGADKDGRWPHRQAIEKAVSAFANSRLGGVLLIGADRRAERPGWELRGLAPPAEREVGMAISKVIQEGVDPVPPHRINTWRISDGRWAAVVWVQPVPQPPCITRDGLVFERVTGRSEKVTDPRELGELFAAGDRARSNAEANAIRGSNPALAAVAEFPRRFAANLPVPSATQGAGVVTVAAVAYEPDIGGRLVSQNFADAVERHAAECLFPPYRRSLGPVRVGPTLQWRGWIATSIQSERPWLVRCSWDGSVSVVSSLSPGLPRSDDFLEPALTLAGRVLLELGGRDAAHVVLAGSGPLTNDIAWPFPDDPIRRGISLPFDVAPDAFSPTAADVEYLSDELRRHGGEQLWRKESEGGGK